MILLDTNVVVAFLNGNNLILKNIKEEINRIALSSLVVAELDYGAKAKQPTFPTILASMHWFNHP